MYGTVALERCAGRSVSDIYDRASIVAAVSRADNGCGKNLAWLAFVIPRAIPDANDQPAALSLLRKRELERRGVGLRTDAVRCCDLLRMWRDGTAREHY